jgi:hypothetical protein
VRSKEERGVVGRGRELEEGRVPRSSGNGGLEERMCARGWKGVVCGSASMQGRRIKGVAHDVRGAQASLAAMAGRDPARASADGHAWGREHP